VVRFSPENVTGVPQNAVVDVEFSEPLDPATVVAANVVLQVSQTGTVVPTTITLREGNRIVRLTAALAADTQYFTQVTPGLRDTQGTALAFTQAFFFTTGATSDGTAPAVSAVTPPDGTTGVGVNAVVRVRFSERINPLTVSGSTVQIVGGGQTVVPATISFETAGTEVLVTPLEPLPDGTVMTVTISGVEDLAGRAVAPLTSTFTTSAVADTVGPTVVASSVVGGETNVPVNAVVELEYSEALDPQSVTSGNIQLVDNATGQPVPATVGLSGDGRTVTLAPSVPLAVGRSHFLQAFSVRDVSGNSGAFLFLSFTTSTAADTTAPEVVLVSPEAGLTGVPINADLQVLFDEPVRATSLEQVQVRVGGSPIAVTRTLSNGNRTLTLTPAVPLTANTVHTIAVSGVRDTAGNTGAPESFSFTTGPGADFVAPAAPEFSPANGATNVPVSGTIQVTFSEAMNPISMTNNNLVLLVQATGTPVPTSMSFSADLRTVILTPTPSLAPGTQYQVIANSAVTDLAGNGVFGIATFTTAP